MGTFAGEFNLPWLERVISGSNSIDTLGVELDRRGLMRPVLVTGRTLSASALLGRVIRSLGDRCTLVFGKASQHVPSCTVTDLVRTIEQHRADCVISFGGGSPIDTVKAAIYTLVTAGAGETPSETAGPTHVAIPTTLSAGEFTSVAGITDEKTRIKRAVSDKRIAPRSVIMDPTVTLETPGWLWSATGIRSLDHAVESVYSIRHHPLGDVLASRGLALLVEHLPRSIASQGEEQLEHRLQCQMAAWMCVFGITNAGFGLSHALGHQIGPRWNVPHGITSCITLPHAMRLMANVAPERFRPIAEGLGLSCEGHDAKTIALACADRTAQFIAQLDLPGRLQDAHIPRAELDDIVGVVQEAMERAQVVGRPVTRDEIRALLLAAY